MIQYMCVWLFSLSMLQDAIFFFGIIVLKQCVCIVCYVCVCMCVALLLNLSLLHQIV